MEIGLVFALLSAILFAASNIFLRRGVSKAGESLSALMIAIFMGLLLFSLMMFFTGEWDKVWSLSVWGWVLLGGAGIIHFVIGRYLAYIAVRLIGANRAIAITRSNMLYAVIFGVLLLSEPITLPLILGVVCLTLGVTLVSMERQGPDTKELSQTSKLPAKGVLYALIAGLLWGISGIPIKLGVAEIGSPLAGAFVSFIPPSIIMAGLLFRERQREELFRLTRSPLIYLAIAGALASVSQLFRYFALSYSPISLVQPLLSTNVLFLLLFSFFINRHIEVFTVKVIIGVVVTVAGGVLLSY
ncbi:EamA family transporter [Chloroflexota bacterium]